MKFESNGYGKASPSLRWMAQQQEEETNWRPDMARQQAAVWFAPPDEAKTKAFPYHR